MTLKCIKMVYDSITERFLCTSGFLTKYFERFLSVNKQLYLFDTKNYSLKKDRKTLEPCSI